MRCGLTRDEYRRRITSVVVLATLFLIQVYRSSACQFLIPVSNFELWKISKQKTKQELNLLIVMYIFKCPLIIPKFCTDMPLQ